MNIIDLKQRELSSDPKAIRNYNQLGELLAQLRKRNLPPVVVEVINRQVEELNASPSMGKAFIKMVKQKQTRIIGHVAKELKIVPKGYYRNLWLVLGMTTFGLPLGVAFGLALKNMGLLGVGFPIGMAIGVGVGAAMDKKAAKEGRQLDMEIKH